MAVNRWKLDGETSVADISRHALMAPSFAYIPFSKILDCDIMDVRFKVLGTNLYYDLLEISKPGSGTAALKLLENAILLRDNYKIDFGLLKVSSIFTEFRIWFEICEDNICVNVFTYDFKNVHYQLDNGIECHCSISALYKKHPAFKWYNKFWHNFKLRYNLEF